MLCYFTGSISCCKIVFVFIVFIIIILVLILLEIPVTSSLMSMIVAIINTMFLDHVIIIIFTIFRLLTVF